MICKHHRVWNHICSCVSSPVSGKPVVTRDSSPSPGAVGHQGDSLVEKILTVLEPLPAHVTDVQVDMLELTSVQRTPQSRNTVAPGCLAQTQ